MKNLFHSRKLLFVTLSVLVTIPVAVLILGRGLETRELATFGDIPHFELTERTGAKVSDATLRGKVWVAGFIFTHCEGQCPLISKEMQKIEKRLRTRDKFRLVSISVDPENDTPEELAQYATKWQADPFRWLFLTGAREDISSLVQQGFRLAAVGGASGEGDIIHSDKLVLVDGGGRIRGYYDGTDDKEVDNLLRDTKALLKKTL